MLWQFSILSAEYDSLRKNRRSSSGSHSFWKPGTAFCSSFQNQASGCSVSLYSSTILSWRTVWPWGQTENHKSEPNLCQKFIWCMSTSMLKGFWIIPIRFGFLSKAKKLDFGQTLQNRSFLWSKIFFVRKFYFRMRKMPSKTHTISESTDLLGILVYESGLAFSSCWSKIFKKQKSVV